MNKIIRLMAALILMCGLYGCSTLDNSSDTSQHASLGELKQLRYDDQGQGNTSSGGAKTIREVALYETGLSLGMRTGLAYRAEQINAELEKKGPEFYKLFDFSSLLLKKQVLPPVLIEARHTVDAEGVPTPEMDPTDALLLANNPSGQSIAKTQSRVDRSTENIRTLRITDRVFRIVRQARFALTIPTWRDYLYLNYPKPPAPQAALLPQDSSEAAVWEAALDAGWTQGIEQADQIFQQNLALLKRDYMGMVCYKSLLAQNMVSAPFVAERHYGTTGGGDEMKVRDRVLTIAALPALKADGRVWQSHVIEFKEHELERKLDSLFGSRGNDDPLAASFKVAHKKNTSLSKSSISSRYAVDKNKNRNKNRNKTEGEMEEFLEYSDKPGDKKMLLDPWTIEK